MQKIPLQNLIRKLRVSRGIVTHMERKCFLHGKRGNYSLVALELLATYIIAENDSDFGQLTN